MRATNIIRAAAYCTEGDYANPYEVASYICSTGNDATREQARAILANRHEELMDAARQRPVTNAVAQAWVVARDILRMIDTIDGFGPEFFDETALLHRFGTLVELVEGLGYDLGGTSLHLVDDFPGPYAGSEGWAMNLDVSDKRAYGVDVGVYVRRELLMPVYTDFLLCHELVHAICGRRDSEYLARGLEDGLGDVFGGLILAPNVLSSNDCHRMLMSSRALFPQSQFWMIYSDNLHLALMLHDLVGIQGIEDALKSANRQGRGAIKLLERQLLTLAGSDLARDGARYSTEVQRFTRVYRSMPRSLVVSPLAYYLAEHLRLGMTTPALFNDLAIDKEEGQHALRELQERVFLVFVDKGEIWADETKVNLENHCLRYEVQP
jgi:hypothetical protein